MVDVRNRRPIWFLCLLPLGVTVLSILAISFVAGQRAKLIGPLADAVAEGSTREAVVAIQQLARMSTVPIDLLVSAAASPDPQIAAAAQSAVGGVLQSYERRIQTGRRVADVADQLSTLVNSLADHQKSFPPADQLWIGQTTHEVLRLANQLPKPMAPSLAARCDTILATVAANAASPAPPAAHRPAPFEPSLPAVEVVMIPIDRNGESSSSINASSPFEQRQNNSSPTPPTIASQPARVPRANPAETPIQPGKPSVLDWRPQRGNATPSTASSSPMKIVSVSPVESSGATTTASPQNGAATTTADVLSLADIPPRKLLEHWLTANKADAAAIEAELVRRGFGRVPRRLVEQYFSAKTADRLRLVDDVLSAPDVAARPWLLLLADDPHADVRLLAVTVMATSNDRILLDKAFQVAIRDSDPRIADLAARLNERRNGAGRR